MTRAPAWLTVSLLLLLGVSSVLPEPPGRAQAASPRVGGLTALPPAEAPGPNLLKNPGFEDTAAAGMAGWTGKPAEDAWSVDGSAKGGRSAVRLSGANRHRFPPALEQTVTLEPGLYTIEGWVKTQDLGGAGPRHGVRICLDGRSRIEWWQCTPLARGTTDWTHLRQPSVTVRARGVYRFTVGAYGAPDGSAWFDDLSLTEIRKPRLEVYLLQPNFRGMLFDDRPQTVRAAVTVREPRSGDTVRLRLLDEQGTVVQQRDSAATAAGLAELDAAGTREGSLLLRAELLDGAGKAVATYPDYRIVKLPAKARAKLNVWYDERNVTHLGGKPAFILGLYTTSGYSTTRNTYAFGPDGWANERIAQAPINMLINYHTGQAPIPALTTYLDDLHARGIYFLHTVNFYYEDDPLYRSINYPAARDGADALNRWIARTLSAHPGLAGFYTADERPADMVPKVFRQHGQLAAAAPGSFTYVVHGDGWEHQAPLWRDALDVMGLDPYPIVKPRGQNNLAMVGEWTRIGQEAVKRSRPVWMVIQYFPLTAQGGWPTEEELRTMSWMAIVEGAQGLFYWSFGEKGLRWVKDPKLREQRWGELVRVTREIKGLERVLLAPDAPVVTRESSGGAVRTLGKRLPDGTRYLFAYNSTASPRAVTWTLDAPASETVDPVTSAPGPRVSESTLSDRLGPFEVKRYRIQ